MDELSEDDRKALNARIAAAMGWRVEYGCMEDNVPYSTLITPHGVEHTSMWGRWRMAEFRHLPDFTDDEWMLELMERFHIGLVPAVEYDLVVGWLAGVVDAGMRLDDGIVQGALCPSATADTPGLAVALAVDAVVKLSATSVVDV